MVCQSVQRSPKPLAASHGQRKTKRSFAKTLSVDVRILAATNRNLEEVKGGKFREDLFYRLNVVTLRIPPLCERQDDIPLLAQHFLTKYANKNHKRTRGFSPLAMDMLLKHAWPGNVRELENTIEIQLQNWIAS